jgi:hypothetical protein
MRSPSVTWREVGDEVAVSANGNGGVELLPPKARTVWQFMANASSFPELVASVTVANGRPSQELASDVEDVVVTLMDTRLVEAVADVDD